VALVKHFREIFPECASLCERPSPGPAFFHSLVNNFKDWLRTSNLSGSPATIKPRREVGDATKVAHIFAFLLPIVLSTAFCRGNFWEAGHIDI